MPQESAANMSGQELSAGGQGNTFGGNTTGSICTSSGTYSAENKYMRNVIVMAAGEAFPPFVDGKKITWTALTQTVAGSKTSDGGFTSVKVEAGAL